LAGAKERVSVLEMLSSMIRSRVSVLEEAMEIDPPITDLSGDDDSTDSEYADVDDGGAMLVDDSEEENNGTRRTLSRFQFLLLSGFIWILPGECVLPPFSGS
jgi:hypothetical protein